MACGCLLGMYETYGGRVLDVIDHVAASCSAHVSDQIVSAIAASCPSGPEDSALLS